MLIIKNTSWIKNGKALLKEIDWSVGVGEHWAMIGLNGSGKTSLINLIGGYEWPTKGQIDVLGYRFGQCDLREVRKEIGHVSPMIDRMLHPSDTVFDVVLSGYFASFGLYEQVSDEVKQLAQQAIKCMGMEALADKTYGILSQGERKKAQIARALINQPKLLILDEPCSGLDIQARENFLSELNTLVSGQWKCNMIYVTHHIEEILPFISHVLLMKEGQVSAAGRKEEILTSHRLSEVFNIPLEVSWYKQRPYAQIK